ncbi:MAG: GAF domain-containing protein [Anaerolineales bacterium]|nr:GAF domain-containing protein [Chloroflexota bacterium]MBL6980762.1 GAF domain-containing protein [Anaerolineales bacterium]
MSKSEDKHSNLGTTNSLLEALGRVSAHLAAEPDPDKLMKTMGEELMLLEIQSLVALLDSDLQNLCLRFIAVKPNLLEKAEKLVNRSAIGLEIPRKNWAQPEVFDQGISGFDENAAETLAGAIPGVPKSASRLAIRTLGIKVGTSMMHLPLVVGEKTIGLLSLWGESLDPIFIKAYQIFADQVAASLATAQLHDQLASRRVDEQSSLLNLSNALLMESDPTKIMEIVTNTVAEALDVPFVGLLTPEEIENPQYLKLRAVFGGQLEQIGIYKLPISPKSGAGSAFELGEPMVIHALNPESPFQRVIEARQLGLQAGLVAPMKAGDKIIGTLGAADPKKRNFDDDDVRMLSLIANTAAQALENSRHFVAEQAARKQAETLREIAVAFNTTLNLAEMLDLILEQLERVVSFDSTSIMLFDEKGLEIVAQRNLRYTFESIETINFEEFPNIKEVLNSRKPLIVDDVKVDSAWVPVLGSEYIRNWMGVPLIVRERIFGLLNLDKEEPGFYTSDHARLAAAFAAQAAVSIERSKNLAKRRIATQALMESNQKYSALFHFANDAIFSMTLDGFVQDANQQAADMLGYRLDELIGMSAYEIIADQEESDANAKLDAILSGEILPIYERQFRKKDGSQIPVEVNLSLVRDDQGQPRYLQSIVRDISARKQFEAARQRYEFIANTSKDFLCLVSKDYHYEAVNDAFCMAFNKPRDEIVGSSLAEIWGVKEFENEFKSYFDRCFDGEELNLQSIQEFPALGWRNVDTSFIPFQNEDGQTSHAVVVTRDITDQERAKSEIKLLAKFPEENPNPVIRVVADGSIIFANLAADSILKLFGLNLGDQLPEVLLNPAVEIYQNGLADEFDIEIGDRVYSFAYAPVTDAGYLNIYGRDITARILVENDIQHRTQELERLYHASGALISSDTTDLGGLAQAIVDVVLRIFGKANCSLLLVDPESSTLIRAAVSGPYADEVSSGKLSLEGPGLVPKAIKLGEIINLSDVRADPNYIPNWEAANSEMAVPLKLGDRVIGVIDIQSADSEAFGPEDERLVVAFAERAALALERQRGTDELRKFSRAVEQTAEGVMISDPQGIIEYVNPAFEAVSGYSKADLVGTKTSVLNSGQHKPEVYENLWEIILNGETYQGVLINKKKDGSLYYEEKTITPLKDTRGNITQFVSTGRDITKRIQSDEEIRRRAAYLQSLHAVEVAITGSLDLNVTLNVLVDQVITTLGVDAVGILLLDNQTQMLEHAARQGFRTNVLKYTTLRIGEGFAGQAALEQKVILLTNLDESTDQFPESTIKNLMKEEFVAYIGVPLIAKGRVAGVLEIFNRSPLESDPQILEFLETMASQAAIAIDNAALFNDLQRSNLELKLAYNTTLEGWTKALELRDQETEGHTRRVAEMTVGLAHEFGISNEDIAHIYRGALLHDIGKIGIPDSILLKPDKLTDEEWEIMRQHPVHAFDFISQIEYLRPAVEIPFCHHERWDGTGYPRGLQDVNIPLSARIFAVIDVWDALISNRPYRRAWEKSRAKEHILNESGSHFDPSVVEKFMQMID